MKVMKAKLKQVTGRDNGFTLTELAVAMLIVGILAAIAIPSFLGSRNNAYDREAQASVDAVLAAAEQHYANFGDFSDSAGTTCGASTQITKDIQKLDANVKVINSIVASQNPRSVSVNSAVTFNSNDENLGCQAFYAVALSRSGNCYVGRLTVEGAYLTTGSADAIIVKNSGSTKNNSNTAFSAEELNGRAYGVIKVDGAQSNDPTATGGALDDVKTLCTAATMSDTVDQSGVTPTEFYDSWRTTVQSANGSNL